MRKFLVPGLLSLALFLLQSCSKSNESFYSDTIRDYYPGVVGKYIIYNLDSTVFINFGARDTIIKYQVKDQVDAQVKDNSGRTAYRIIRSIRKNSTQPWTGNNTFLVVPTENSLEFVENNMRFIKLKTPVRDGYSWKGNSFIDTYSLNSDVKYLDDWDYTYQKCMRPWCLGHSGLTVL